MKDKSVVKDFPIVCVGGSAGGLDAYTRCGWDLADEETVKRVRRVSLPNEKGAAAATATPLKFLARPRGFEPLAT